MRTLIILICISVTSLSPCLAQVVTRDRSSILYVVGQVASATERSCIVDIGAVHTIADQEQLVVFRPIHGYLQPIGRITVTQSEATTSRCKNQVRSQPNDIVITVREISQLRPGAVHRGRIVRRHVVRSYRQTSSTNVNNIHMANALSDYELQYPNWERSRGEVAGTLLSTSLKDSTDDEALRRLRSQINMMRRFYQQDAQTVAAAGTTWSSIMPLLAGPTAEAGHALRLKDLKDGDLSEDAVQVAAAELRSRVFDRIFQLQREQQNVVALIVASLIPGSSRDNTIFLRTSISQTQFPDLSDDPELLEDIDELVLSIRDGI